MTKRACIKNDAGPLDSEKKLKLKSNREVRPRYTRV